MTIRGVHQNSKVRFKKVKRTLLRRKNPQYPKLPKTFLEFKNMIIKPEYMSKYGYTHDGESRFYIDTVVTPDYEFIVFASHHTINFIKSNIPPESRNYVADGTFNSLPLGSYQLLIIAIEFQNDVSFNYRFSQK